MLTYRVELSAAECQRASRDMFHRRRYSALVQYLWLIGPLVLLCVLGVNRAANWVLVLCAAGIPALGLLNVGDQLWRRRRIARVYRTTPGLAEPQLYEFHEDALETSNSVERAHTRGARSSKSPRPMRFSSSIGRAASRSICPNTSWVIPTRRKHSGNFCGCTSRTSASSSICRRNRRRQHPPSQSSETCAG